MLCRATGVPSLFLFLLFTAPAVADPVRVGVASNFAGPARELAAQYEAETGHAISLSTASTGKLYAQIRAGAPFDVLLAADELRPQRLVADGFALTAAVYAIGRLAIVSADPGLRGADCREAFLAATAPTLAIANPDTAPYGLAASAWLQQQRVAGKLDLVRGENVGQAMGFVVTGNARFGIVALSQFLPVEPDWQGCATALPAASHPPVRQAAALLAVAAKDQAAAGFFEYLFSADAAATLSKWGYMTPGRP